MQYLHIAIVILGSSLILAALMHRANNPRRRSFVHDEPAQQPQGSADASRAAWLIAGAFTLLGVLQLNSYIERERAMAMVERMTTLGVEAAVATERAVHETRGRLMAEGKYTRSLVR